MQRGDNRLGWLALLNREQSCSRLITLRGHGFAEALQALDVLHRFGLADVGTLALSAEHQSLVVQVPQGLANGDAADAKGIHQLVFRRQALMNHVAAFEHLAPQVIADLPVQRLWGVARGEGLGWCGRASWRESGGGY